MDDVDVDLLRHRDMWAHMSVMKVLHDVYYQAPEESFPENERAHWRFVNRLTFLELTKAIELKNTELTKVIHLKDKEIDKKEAEIEEKRIEMEFWKNKYQMLYHETSRFHCDVTAPHDPHDQLSSFQREPPSSCLDGNTSDSLHNTSESLLSMKSSDSSENNGKSLLSDSSENKSKSLLSNKSSSFNSDATTVCNCDIIVPQHDPHQLSSLKRESSLDSDATTVCNMES
jgi:hypothetical protein